MSRDLQELWRWLAARGVTDERLEAYREGIEQILREAGEAPVAPPHVEAARRALQAAGARPRTLAHLKNAADALRRFQRGDSTESASLRALSVRPPATELEGAAPSEPGGSFASPRAATSKKPRTIHVVTAVLAGLVVVSGTTGLYFWLFEAALDKVNTWRGDVVPAERSPAEPPMRGRSREVVRPADWPQLLGTWQGNEIGRSNEWTLTFTGDYRLAATSSRGESYSGEAMIRWDLGLENDYIPVPAGWGPLDVAISEASDARAVGKVALSAFSLSAGELRFCGGPPGYGRRVASFESPGAPFRCMTLRKAGSAGDAVATDSTATPSPSPEAAPAPEVTAAPEAAAAPPSPGFATLLLDGVAEHYPLQTGFFSDTRVAMPQRATLHFAAPAPQHSNQRRILLTLDATKTGQHYADGDAIHAMMFENRAIEVGQLSAAGRAAVFKWVADGGQSFPPKRGTRCTITVLSPYTATDASEFRAEISHCSVFSAGIDRTLSSVKLHFKGKLDR